MVLAPRWRRPASITCREVSLASNRSRHEASRMSWLIPASAVILLAGLGAYARRVLRRRQPQNSGTTEVAEGPEPRVRQFIHTGSHRMPEPRSAATDLRHEAQAMLEEAEVASDLATLDAFLIDVRDSLGADEAVFWRWSEKRDALAPASWSTVGATRPKHFDMHTWGPLVKWAAEGRV